MAEEQVHDPLNFMRNLWGNMGFTLPGMVAPTFDLDELDKRIKDMKAVEGWLRMNLSMLQMTIQGLEMQCVTLNAVRAMGQMAGSFGSVASSDDSPGTSVVAGSSNEALKQVAMWPLTLLQQMQEQMQKAATAATQANPPPEDTAKS